MEDPAVSSGDSLLSLLSSAKEAPRIFCPGHGAGFHPLAPIDHGESEH